MKKFLLILFNKKIVIFDVTLSIILNSEDIFNVATTTKKVHLHEVFGSSLLHVSNLNDGKTMCSKVYWFL
jgi:hypothetical protein